MLVALTFAGTATGFYRQSQADRREQQGDIIEACQERNEVDLGLRVFADRLDARWDMILRDFGVDIEDRRRVDLTADTMLPPFDEMIEDCDGDGHHGDPGDLT